VAPTITADVARTAEVRCAQLRRCTAQAPLAQSAERLHAMYLARIAVLTRKIANHPRMVCAYLDALIRPLLRAFLCDGVTRF
jgi:hypothetical protein